MGRYWVLVAVVFLELSAYSINNFVQRLRPQEDITGLNSSLKALESKMVILKRILNLG